MHTDELLNLLVFHWTARLADPNASMTRSSLNVISNPSHLERFGSISLEEISSYTRMQ